MHRAGDTPTSAPKGKLPRWAVFALVGGAIIGAFVLGAVLLTAAPVTPDGGGGQAVFDVRAVDGATGKVLPDSDITYELFGTDDMHDWLSFESLETGTDISNILEADLDTDYTFWAVKVSAEVEHSDTLYSDDQGTREYYERWYQVAKGVMNTFVLYETPNQVGIVAWDSIDITPIAAIATVINPQNISIMVACNSTQTGAMYVAGSNFENEINDTPAITVTFSAPVALTDFKIAGTTQRRVSANAIAYEFYMISAVPAVFNGKWSTSAPVGLAIASATVSYGTTVLATAA